MDTRTRGCMEEIASSAEIKNACIFTKQQPSLRKRLRILVEVTFGYLYSFSSSAFCLARLCNLRKCVWKEKLFWIRYSDRSILWDSKKISYFASKDNVAFCISVERISGNDLCPVEDFKSKFSCCFFPVVLKIASWG